MKKRWILLLIVILGSFLRLYRIDSKSLWLDEACSLYRAQKQFLPMLKEIVRNDAHPPLYSTLLHFWVYKGRNVSLRDEDLRQAANEGWTRGLSALLGILTIPLIYQMGRLLLGEKAGLWASLLMSTSAYQIFYAQEARLPTLIIFLTILSLYFFYRSLGERKKILWLGFILSTTLSLYTFLYSIFFILAENLFFLINFKRYRSALRGLVTSQLVILVLFSPWIPVLIQRIALVKSAPPAPGFSLLTSLSNIYLVLLDFTFGYPRFSFRLASLTILIFLSLIVYGLAGRPRKAVNLLLLLWLLIPLLLALFFPLRVHTFQSKYIIFSSPAYYLLLTQGLTRLKSRKISTALLSLFIILNLASLRIYYSKGFVKEDWRGTVSYVEENSRPQDIILFDPNYLGFAFDRYYSGSLDRVGVRQEGAQETISRLSINYARIWLIQDFSLVSQPSRDIPARLEEEYERTFRKTFPGLNGHIVVGLYLKK